MEGPVAVNAHIGGTFAQPTADGDVRNHLIRLNADRFLPTDPSGLPLALAPVEGPFDLRRERLIGQDWLNHPQLQQAKGYDHAFVLNGPTAEWAARVVSGDRQLAMEVYTNQPSLQFYTGNWLANTPARDGQLHQDHAGFCLEAQQLPDSPNRPELGDPWLLPGQTYRHQTRYRFITAD